MTIVRVKELTPADVRHLGANLAARVRQDRQDARATSFRSASAEGGGAGPVSLTSNKKELVSC